MPKNLIHTYTFCVVLIVACLCLSTATAHAQGTLQITHYQTGRTVTAKKGDYMQFYYAATPMGEPLFVFGQLRYLTESSIVLSNGAELALDKITHIDRVPLFKRTWWTSMVLGTATGAIAVATQASPIVTTLMMAPPISLNLHYGVKYNRRHLKKNQVGYVVDVTILP